MVVDTLEAPPALFRFDDLSEPVVDETITGVLTGTVLVVDDKPKVGALVRSYLEREGYRVFDTGSGDDAVAIVRRVQPDLVVLDLGLPDLAGEEVIRIVRRTLDVRVVMLTARASEGDP